MDFAKRQLEKYGWKEGSGLGKQSNGINVALKPALKFDKCGVGFNKSEEYTNNWWETLYNKASNNISVTTKDNIIKVKTKHQDAFEITTKKASRKPTKTVTSSEYGSFIKTEKLTETGIVSLHVKYEATDTNSIVVPNLTDDELFAACGGRTAHKGARHGLKLNGKLSRLEMQEKLLLKQLNRVTLSDETEKNKKTIEKKLKKIEYHKSKNRSENATDVLPPTSPCLLKSISPFRCNKKRKNERKHVAFNETVVEFLSQDCNETTANTDSDATSHTDEAPQSLLPIVTVRKLKTVDDADRSNNNNNNNQVGDLDEGIDCTEYDITKEESKWDLQEKIRKDNRRMKRKLKVLRILKEDDIPSENEDFVKNSEKTKWAKRKLFEPQDLYDPKKARCSLENPYKCKIKKSQRKLLKEQRLLEQNIDKVTNTFDNICKISLTKTE